MGIFRALRLKSLRGAVNLERRLSETSPEERESILLSALEEEDPLVRGAALARLASQPCPPDVAMMIAPLAAGATRSSGDAELDAALAISESPLGADEISRLRLWPLLRRAVAHPLPEVRAWSYLTFGWTSDPNDADVVARGIHDEDPEVRGHVVQALGMIGGETAVQALRAVAASDEPGLREHARDALQRIARRSGAR